MSGECADITLSIAAAVEGFSTNIPLQRSLREEPAHRTGSVGNHQQGGEGLPLSRGGIMLASPGAGVYYGKKFQGFGACIEHLISISSS